MTLASCSPQAQSSMSLDEQNEIFECKLEVEPSFVIGESVNVLFKLSHSADRSLYILSWYTPLEGLAGEIFRVTREGEQIPYQGILAKRGEPTGEDYRAMDPGETLWAVVDLSTGYDLSEPGRYQVEFTSQLYDVSQNSFSIPRKVAIHQPQSLDCNQVNFEIVQP